MSTSSTFVKDPSTGMFSSTGNGMANTAPSAATPYGSPATGYFANYDDAVSAANKVIGGQSTDQTDSSQTSSTPTGSMGSLAPQPFTPPNGKVSVPTSTGNPNLDAVLGIPAGSPPPPAGTNPYSLFNNYVASILTQIQGGANAGRQNLAGAANTLTSLSVAPNGPQTADPGVFSNNQIQNQQTLQAGFTPAITSINSQLQNANAGIAGLNQVIPAIQAANQPQAVSGGSSLFTPGGQNLGTAPVYNSNVNQLTQQPYGWTSAPGSDSGSSSGGLGSGIATSTGNVDLSTYATDPNYIASMKRQYTATSNDVQSLLPQFNNDLGSALTQYIKNNGGSSKITGQMIISAANSAGIDPLMLASQMLHETDFGATGEAPKNNNPGGVKFANQPGATRGSPAPDGGDFANFQTWSQGIAAQAQWIASHQTSLSQTSSNTTQGTNTLAGLPPYVSSMITTDAQAMATGSEAPANVKARYDSLPGGIGGIYYNLAIAQAEKINHAFSETKANLTFKGQQTQTENLNSGNPLTNIFSHLTNAVSTPSIFSPVKPQQGTLSNGVDLSQFNQ